MADFIFNCILWVFALYGIIEIIKNIFYIKSCNCIETNGIHLVLLVKNQENKIEGLLRSLNFRILYGKEECIEDILVLDLNSNDNTKKIVENISLDSPNIKILNWKEFEELFSPQNK